MKNCIRFWKLDLTKHEKKITEMKESNRVKNVAKEKAGKRENFLKKNKNVFFIILFRSFSRRGSGEKIRAEECNRLICVRGEITFICGVSP